MGNLDPVPKVVGQLYQNFDSTSQFKQFLSQDFQITHDIVLDKCQEGVAQAIHVGEFGFWIITNVLSKAFQIVHDYIPLSDLVQEGIVCNHDPVQVKI